MFSGYQHPPIQQLRLLFIFVIAAYLIFGVRGGSQTPHATGIPLATEDRVRNPGWWPTKGVYTKAEYVGTATCAECHALKAATQKTTPMAAAAVPVADAAILHRQASLTFTSGSYKFEISQAAGQSIYSVSDGMHSISQPLEWAFGTGEVGQTYVYEREGNYYESRVSFFPSLQGLDLTLGHRTPVANDVNGALGRPMPASEVKLCFGCHTTRSTSAGRFDASGLIPGVTCEACHGPGAKHVAAMRQKDFKRGLQSILNPARLNPVDSVDFCGACHRTAWDVVLANTTGIANVRFQPYRLEKSRCWRKGDARLTCIACHDPHLPLVRDAAAYDRQCLTCHKSPSMQETGNHPGRACPVATAKCVSCHMAKYEIPGSYAKFTDHWIRAVKAGTTYPD